MSNKRAVIIGAGPAGLTAAYELLDRTDLKPMILEKTEHIGGLARTLVYKGNRIDIGPHRFFSKSDRVMDWWLSRIPLAATNGGTHEITYQNQKRTVEGSEKGVDPTTTDNVMLTLERTTRIFYLRKLFDYPISLKAQTILNLGIFRTFRVGCSYLKAAACPIKPEENLEQFLINRFGRELYLTFFKDYTEKVWGIECDKISAAWGAQRIKGLNISKAIGHALRKILSPVAGLKQKQTETSLVERFLFPKLGTGQMWEHVASQVRDRQGEIVTKVAVEKINVQGNKVVSITAVNEHGERFDIEGDVFFSTMPIKELIRALSCEVPPQVKEISEGLVYRDFVQVGLLVNRLKVTEPAPGGGRRMLRDNWIYVQESDVKVGRMEIWNNWGGSMVADPSKVWLGMEYFCNENDEVWSLPDPEMMSLATNELEKLGMADKSDVLDGLVMRVPKTYPGYFGTYDRFDELVKYIDQFENLFLIGRNGQHKYNNQDHSMLSAMTAVDNIVAGVKSKDNIWSVNTEMEYHEEKTQT